jgi:hypothetical protein
VPGPASSSIQPRRRDEAVVSLARAARFAAAAAALALGLVGVAPAQTHDGKTSVLWLGQSAFKITSPTGKVIVIDPYLTANPKTPDAYRKLEALGKVDLTGLAQPGHRQGRDPCRRRALRLRDRDGERLQDLGTWATPACSAT